MLVPLLRTKFSQIRAGARRPTPSGAFPLGVGFLLLSAGAVTADLPPGYLGKPYKDSILEVPGRLRLFRFDEGPKESVWHDYEPTNAWYCKVRAPAAVGLQLMGAGGDKWEPGKAEPGMTLVKDDCYMAQTNQGDWTKYTVRVKAKGVYSMSFLEAANGTTIPFLGVSFLNGADSVGTGKITLPLTSYFHNWVYARNLAALALDTGLQVMRFDIVGNGPMNINYIDFEPASGVPIRAAERASTGRGPAGRGPALRRASRTSGGQLLLTLESPVEGTLRLEAFDVGGQALFSESIPATGRGGIEFLIRPAAIPSGVAILRLSRGEVTGEARAFAF